jgi:ribonuclease D
MQVVNKEMIQKMDDESTISEKKHTKKLNMAVKDPPKKSSVPLPKKLPKRRVSFRDLQSSLPPPPEPFTEYRQSFEDIMLKLGTSLESHDHQAGLKEKLLNSKDIRRLVVENIPIGESDNPLVTLTYTVIGKILENRLGI